jgi:hypothetical protein
MRTASNTRDAVPASAVLAAGWASVAIGVAALVGVAAAPLPVVGVLAGTAGIVAAVAGVAALRARSPEAPVALLGVAAGGIAALLLVAQLGLTLVERRSVPAAGGPAPAAAAVPTRAALTQSVNTLAYLLAQSRTADGAWPAGLAVTDDGRVYATSGPNVGHLLLQAPAGASVSYAVSADRSRCVLTMAATADRAVLVRFSSATGLSTNE